MKKWKYKQLFIKNKHVFKESYLVHIFLIAYRQSANYCV